MCADRRRHPIVHFVGSIPLPDSEIVFRTLSSAVGPHLKRMPDGDDHTLYSSHSLWHSRADFEAWTRSEAFRLAHRDAGGNRPLYLGHPEFEGFEVVQTVEPA